MKKEEKSERNYQSCSLRVSPFIVPRESGQGAEALFPAARQFCRATETDSFMVLVLSTLRKL